MSLQNTITLATFGQEITSTLSHTGRNKLYNLLTEKSDFYGKLSGITSATMERADVLVVEFDYICGHFDTDEKDKIFISVLPNGEFAVKFEH